MKWASRIKLQPQSESYEVAAGWQRYQTVHAETRYLLPFELLVLADTYLEIRSFEVSAFASR